MNEEFSIKKIDYAVTSLALGHACKVLAELYQVPLKTLQDDLIRLANEQASTLKWEQIESIANSYLDGRKANAGLGFEDLDLKVHVQRKTIPINNN
jgi:hypothetical protein